MKVAIMGCLPAAALPACSTLVRLDAPVRQAGRCHRPVEVRADGRLWRRFLVSPDGNSVLTPSE